LLSQSVYTGEMEVVRHFVWFAIVATAATFVIFFVVGNFFVGTAENAEPVPVRDVISDGAQHLSGMILLPLACEELTVQTQKVSANGYLLAFQTWQDPSVPCPTTPPPREFDTVVFATSTNVEFSATLNGNGFPITVLPESS